MRNIPFVSFNNERDSAHLVLPPQIERHPQEIDSLDIIERHANQFCTYSVYYCTYSRDIGQTD